LRVKLTYTVDSEEVLKEVKRLVNLKLMNLKPMIDISAAHDFEGSPVKDSLDLVDRLRKQLFDLDTILGDVDGILKSYVESNLGKPRESNE